MISNICYLIWLQEVNNMKNIPLFGLIFAILIILIAFASIGIIPMSNSLKDTPAREMTQQSLQVLQSASFRNVTYAMTLDLPEKTYPDKILIFKTVKPDLTRSRFDEYVKKFNVSGKFREGENGMSIQTEDLVYSIEISAVSGRVIYNVANRPNKILDIPEKLPADDEAVRIATKFLKENNLFPEGAKTGKPERYYTLSTDKNGNEIQRAGHIEVWFGRKLNDLDVWGTQFYVDIGGNGDIIGYYANWREYAPAGEYPIKSPEIAFEELKQTGIRTDSGDASISITEATLAYRTKAGAYEEDYLEPIWIFSGEASSGKGVPQPVSKFIPALTDESVKSLSSS